MQKYRYVIFDTETTGVDAEKRAVEIAMLEIDEQLNIVGAADSLINPEIPIPPGATAIHNITDEMVKDAPTISQWVYENFGEGGVVGDVSLIGHRIDFDKPLFAPIGNVVQVLDTLIWAYVYFPEAPNKKLDTLKEHLGLLGGGESHRAAADVLTCYQLLQAILERSGRTLAALASVDRVMVHVCPWGKHEGALLKDVPRKYREWMLERDGLDKHLRYSLEQVAIMDPPREVLPPARKGGRLAFIPRRII